MELKRVDARISDGERARLTVARALTAMVAQRVIAAEVPTVRDRRFPVVSAVRSHSEHHAQRQHGSHRRILSTSAPRAGGAIA